MMAGKVAVAALRGCALAWITDPVLRRFREANGEATS